MPEAETHVAESLDAAAIVEERYGSPEKAKDIREKNKAKVVEKIEPPVEPKVVAKVDEPKAEKVAEKKVIEITEPKPAEKKESAKPEAKKEKEIEVENFYNPLEKKKEKEVKVAAEKTLEDAGKTVREKPIEDLERDRHFDDYKKKAEAYDKFKETPIFPVLENILKNGGDVYSALRELLPTDYKNMPDEARARAYFTKGRGITDPEKVNTLVEQYLELDPNSLQREEMDDKFINTLNLLENDRVKQASQNLNSQATRRDNILSNFSKEVDEVVKDFKKEKPLGIKLSTEELSEIGDLAKSGKIVVIDDDGGIDAVKTVMAHLLLNHAPRKLREVFMNGHYKGTDTVLETVIQPDRNDEGSQKMPEKQEETPEQLINKRYGQPHVRGAN